MIDLLKRHPEIVLRPTSTIRDAMDAMTKSLVGFAVVVDAKKTLLGVMTDLDIRRALLRGAAMSAYVTKAMNKTPLVIREGTPLEQIAAQFGAKGKTHLPIIDGRRRLTGLAAVADYTRIPARHPNRVVVMAGGMGKRLKPLTDDTPKPMLRLGDKPILEHVLEQMVAAGFTHFTFTVNYLAEKIQRHFGSGSRWNADIDYVHEPRPLGTAGALGLIKHPGTEPLLVLNGDILTNVDFPALMDFHRAEKGLATICVKHHEIQVPYGVVEHVGRRLTRFVEKPTQHYLVNAGIYVLDPRALAWLPKRRACDMPEFLNLIRAHKSGGVACFPIQEYWLDIGGPKEFLQAEKEYRALFGR